MHGATAGTKAEAAALREEEGVDAGAVHEADVRGGAGVPVEAGPAGKEKPSDGSSPASCAQ
jgi:hypothetical protein